MGGGRGKREEGRKERGKEREGNSAASGLPVMASWSHTGTRGTTLRGRTGRRTESRAPPPLRPTQYRARVTLNDLVGNWFFTPSAPAAHPSGGGGGSQMRSWMSCWCHCPASPTSTCETARQLWLGSSAVAATRGPTGTTHVESGLNARWTTVAAGS